jgi:hypothetical protein
MFQVLVFASHFEKGVCARPLKFNTFVKDLKYYFSKAVFRV